MHEIHFHILSISFQFIIMLFSHFQQQKTHFTKKNKKNCDRNTDTENSSITTTTTHKKNYTKSLLNIIYIKIYASCFFFCACLLQQLLLYVAPSFSPTSFQYYCCCCVLIRQRFLVEENICSLKPATAILVTFHLPSCTHLQNILFSYLYLDTPVAFKCLYFFLLNFLDFMTY